MLTSEGKNHIRRYLAGWVPSIAQSVAYGIGPKAEASGDTYLQFEVDRADVVLTTYDFVNNKLIFKAEIPSEFAGTIYEVGLFSIPVNQLAGAYGSRLIASFDSESEPWTTGGSPATFTTANTRLGLDSLSHTPALSTTTTSQLTELVLDFSGNSGSDKFLFAFNVGNAFTSNVQFRFMTDLSNYYTFSLGAQTSGYKVTEAAKSSATVTGTPTWANITTLQVLTTSTSGGASAVNYDGIRLEDTDTINPEYVMVSRELLGSPFLKEDGKVQECEFTLDVTL